MSVTSTHPGVAWTTGRRLIVVLLGVTVYFGVASVIKPEPRGASASIDANGIADFRREIQAAFVSPVDPRSTNQAEQELIKRLKARANTAEATHPKGWKLIGTLESREHLLRCWATADGPRYSVHTLDGRLVQDDLPADEVYRGFPDLELPNLRADPPMGADGGAPVPVMLVEPRLD